MGDFYGRRIPYGLFIVQYHLPDNLKMTEIVMIILTYFYFSEVLNAALLWGVEWRVWAVHLGLVALTYRYFSIKSYIILFTYESL